MASEFIKLLDGATATTNLANKNSATTLPTSGYRDLSGRNVRAVRLRFGGTGAANKDFAYQIFIWKKRGDLTTAATATIYDPEEVARGVATLGAKTYVDGGARHYEADTITQTLTPRPSVFVFSPGDERTAWILVDCPAAIGIQAVVDADGGSAAATTCDVFMQELGEGEAALPFELINVINTKVDTVDTVVDALTTNLARVAGYTTYDGWRVTTKDLPTNPGTTPGAALFTLSASGVVEFSIFGYVFADVATGAGEKLTVKTANGTTLIAATTANDLALGELWYDDSPTTMIDLTSAVAPTYIVAATPGNTTIRVEQSDVTAWTTGGITFYCRWRPIHANSTVTAA